MHIIFILRTCLLLSVCMQPSLIWENGRKYVLHVVPCEGRSSNLGLLLILWAYPGGEGGGGGV